MRSKTKLVSTLVLLSLICLTLFGCGGEKNDWRSLYDSTGKYLSNQESPTVGSVGGEWAVIGLARSERLTDAAAKAYLQNAENHVQSAGNDRLNSVKSTENSRLILGITAAGGDPTDIGDHNLLNGLADMDYIKKQGNNGPIWALLAFDCGDYAIPENSGLTRDEMVDFILSQQCSDGGWGFIGDSSDIDMTAMALQSLAPYRDKDNVHTAVEKALSYLSERQTAEGGYESYGAQNCESSAQVIVALCSLGIDPETDERFVKDGRTVIEALCGFAVGDGMFCHQKDKPQGDRMATEQAYYALTAYERFTSGKSALYDMSR